MNRERILEKAIKKITAFQRFGSKPGLSRIKELTRRLGNPQQNLRMIHVAGTNGKGSVSRYLYCVLNACGYRTGLFTSPYLEEFTERIELADQQITPEDLLVFTDQVLLQAERMVEEGLESPTEFEILTAIAFCYFQKKQAEFVVLEVGLGGIGDSTNVIEEALVSCITTISLDHMDYLGDTIQEIAREKAGIIKPGIPVVSGVIDEKAKAVICQVASEKGAPFVDASGFDYTITSQNLHGNLFDVKLSEGCYQGIQISMLGEHQVQNAICALAVLEILNKEYGIFLPEEKIREGLKKAKQKGRIELLYDNPYLFIDGAHNMESTLALQNVMKNLPGSNILMIAGLLKDKDALGICQVWREIGKDFILTEPDHERKLDVDKLKDILIDVGIRGNLRVIPNPHQAVETVLDEMIKGNNPRDYNSVIFTGSLYFIGKVRTIVMNYLIKEGLI